VISPGTFSVRCDGTDRTTGDRCKSSCVLTINALDIAAQMHADAPGQVAFFGARMPVDWKIVPLEKKTLCPSCKP